jgi:hypothetical protein
MTLCYNEMMSIKTNISAFWKSGTVRQLVGATAGMAIAGGLYVGFEQLGSMQLTGMLVQPGATVSENADQVTTAHKEVDEDTQRRLEQRAQTVADQMKQYANTVQPTPASKAEITVHAAQRLAQRQEQLAAFTGQQTQHAAAPTYPGNTSVAPVSQIERLAQRAENARKLREQTESSVRAEMDGPAPVDLAALAEGAQASSAQLQQHAPTAQVHAAATDDTMHEGAQLVPDEPMPKAKRLTNSGAREQLLVILTLAGCAGMALADPARRMALQRLLAGA